MGANKYNELLMTGYSIRTATQILKNITELEPCMQAPPPLTTDSYEIFGPKRISMTMNVQYMIAAF